MSRWMPGSLHKEAVICLGLMSLVVILWGIWGAVNLSSRKAPLAQSLRAAGNKVDLPAGNSLVFSPQAQFTVQAGGVPHLEDGNFLLSTAGAIRVLLANRAAFLQGDRAKVQVYIKNRRPQIRVIEGEVEIIVEGSQQFVRLAAGDKAHSF